MTSNNLPEPVRRRAVTLRLGESFPVDDVWVTVERLSRSSVRLVIEAPRDIPMGLIRRADGTQREASSGE